MHSYGRVTYENVYPGIDLVFYIIQQAGKEKVRLKYDFIVHGNGSEADIRLSYAGANFPFINEKTN